MSFKDYNPDPALNTTIGDNIYIGPNMARDDVRPALQQIAADGREVWDSLLDLPVTDIEGLARVASVSALADTASPIAGMARLLAQSGREGLFVFDSSDLSAQVTSDPAQAIYVAPTATPTGSSGAWVRRYSGAKNATWYGAAGDGATDDATAMQRWLDAGGDLFLPALQFRSSATLIVRKNIHLTGASYGFDSRFTYGNVPGSRIVFDAGAGGFDIQPQWTGTDWTSTTPTQEGAMHSVIENLGLIGANAGATATGIHARTLVHLRNVQVIQFTGKGFDISAGAAAGNNGESGNADLATLDHCHAIANGGNGFHLRGVDANVIKLDTCNSSSNGGWGFYDEAEFSNCYLNCHASSNVSGSYGTPGYPTAPHSFTNCYVEGATNFHCDISSPCVVTGGTLAAVAADHTTNAWTGGAAPDILANDYTTLKVIHFPFQYRGFGGATFRSTDYGLIVPDVTYGLTLQGKGSTGDVAVFNQAGNVTAYNAANSLSWVFSGPITASPAASATPATNGQMTFELTSNTTLKVKVKGSDGVVRSVSLTLA